MVELQVKLRCEEQERLGTLQHRSSLQPQQHPLPIRHRCRTLRGLHSRRQHHNQLPTSPVCMVESISSSHTSGPTRIPTDSCHLTNCTVTQMVSPIKISSAKPVKGGNSTSKSNVNSRGATAPRLATARLMRHSRRAKMRRREYRRLRNLLPSLQEKQEVSKVEVVAEAARYIDDLHERLLHRLKTRGLPEQLKDLPIGVDDVHQGNIQDLVRHIMTVTNPASLPPTKIENTRQLPSFIAKASKHKRP